MELVAQGLTKIFGNFKALDNVDFNIEGKGCYGYLGPNGAGKTTTMKIFTNLLRPTKGKALINGIDVNKEPVKALRYVSALIEDPEPYSYMQVEEFIKFACKLRGTQIDSKTLLDLSEKLKLPPLNSNCAKLSKGQKRRVYLAGLLAQNSDIYILDEPTAGLDPEESIIIRNILAEMKKEKLIFLSSHLLYEVTQVCDYVLFLNKGRIIEKGYVSEISSKFTSKSLRVEFSKPVDEQVIRSLIDSQLITQYRKENDFSYILQYDGKDETRRSIIQILTKYELRSFFDSTLGLEEAYLKLIREEQ